MPLHRNHWDEPRDRDTDADSKVTHETVEDLGPGLGDARQ
jgi:hypothetical protein